MSKHPYRVALTGGIASGKTAVSDLFAKLGVPVIDTDVISRNLVKPGMPALQQIIDHFGNDYLTPDGQLERSKLRQHIFSDRQAQKSLEAIMHPAIRIETSQQINAQTQPYVLVVIPLLLETNSANNYARILLVDVPEEIQLARVMARDHISQEDAASILASQASRSARIAMADDVISNTGLLSDLELKIAKLHEKYLHLSSN